MNQTLDGQNPALVSFCDGYGAIPADYFFCGISAGRLGALITRVPFTKDASGRIFQRCLGRLELSNSDEFSLKPDLVNCYITNLVKGRCLTPDGLNRLPTVEEIAFWLPKLEEELQQVKPRLLIALGDLVFESLQDEYRRSYTHWGIKLRKVKHPRNYQAHGALAFESKSFEQMVTDYKEALKL